jgi:hypothetical protein
LPDAAVQFTSSRNGVYRITYDVPQRINGLRRKPKDSTAITGWFRQAFANNTSLQNGILLLVALTEQWRRQHARHHAETLDRATRRWWWAHLSDLWSGVHITPIARGATGTDPCLTQVNLGPFPINSTPLLTVEVDPTNAAPGQLVRFRRHRSGPRQ